MKGWYVMELLFDLTSNVTTVLVAALAFLGIAVVPIMNLIINLKNLKETRNVKKNTDGLVTKLLAGKDELSDAKQDVSEAKGKAAGMAEKQIEVDKLNKQSDPKDLPKRD